jgi:drug/metabolite transporter (DMT)-like permease
MLNSLLIAALCLIWGATWVVIKIGLGEAPPFYGAAFRFLFAAVILGLMVWIGRRRLTHERGTLFWVYSSGLLMYFGSYAAVYYAEQYIDAALAAIIFASFPFFVAIGAHFYLPAERLSLLKILGLVIGFTGIVVIFGGGLSRPDSDAWWAMFVMLMSPIASAVASIIVKRHLTKQDPVVLNFLQMTAGVVVLFALASSYEDFGDFRWTLISIAAVAFLSIFGSAFTFVTFYHLLKTMEATKLSLIAFVTPIVAALLGWLLLGESPTLATVAGAVLVFIGIWVVNVLGPKRMPRAVGD